MSNIGGRKFLLTLLMIAVGLAVEIATPRGLSPVFASFLAGILAAYHAANTVVTKRSVGSGDNEESDVPAASLPSFNSAELTKDLAEIKEGIGNVAVTSLNTQKLLQSALTGRPQV